MTNYNEMTSKQLKELAKEQHIKNWWTMKKEELIVALEPPKEVKKRGKKGAMIEYNGRSQNICSWARELGVSANTLYHRIYYKKMTVQEAFELPIRGAKS